MASSSLHRTATGGADGSRSGYSRHMGQIDDAWGEGERGRAARREFQARLTAGGPWRSYAPIRVRIAVDVALAALCVLICRVAAGMSWATVGWIWVIASLVALFALDAVWHRRH